MVPFRQTSWQGLVVDAKAMLNRRGSSVIPPIARRAPLSEISTILQSRLAKPSSITRAGDAQQLEGDAKNAVKAGINKVADAANKKL
jgi:hypothetical protein